MSAPRIEVRQLGVADLSAYRALHRFALTESSSVFVETVSDDAARPDSVVMEMLARGDGWGAFEGARLLGKFVLDALPYDCLKHQCWLHAVYLHPDARGSGAGARMISTALAHAASKGARGAALWVNEKNAAARRTYERLGFREAGRIPRGIAIGGTYVDDVLMCLDLSAGTASERLDGGRDGA